MDLAIALSCSLHATSDIFLIITSVEVNFDNKLESSIASSNMLCASINSIALFVLSASEETIPAIFTIVLDRGDNLLCSLLVSLILII